MSNIEDIIYFLENKDLTWEKPNYRDIINTKDIETLVIEENDLGYLGIVISPGLFRYTVKVDSYLSGVQNFRIWRFTDKWDKIQSIYHEGREQIKEKENADMLSALNQFSP